MFEISYKPPLEGAYRRIWLHLPAGLQHPDCTCGIQRLTQVTPQLS